MKQFRLRNYNALIHSLIVLFVNILVQLENIRSLNNAFASSSVVECIKRKVWRLIVVVWVEIG